MLGFGAVFGHKWCYGLQQWVGINIAILEFYPVVLSLYLWGIKMQNRCILFFTNNEALVYVINYQSCNDKGLMFFVRKLVLMQNNILFKAKHVPGVHNILADSFSLTPGKGQVFGSSLYGPKSNRHSPAPAASELAPIISTLLQSSLQPSSSFLFHPYPSFIYCLYVWSSLRFINC